MSNRKREAKKPFVLWFTGLSGSGKSTIAEAVSDLLNRKNIKLEALDGDRIRDVFPNTGFDKEARIAHIKRVGYLAGMLEKNGISVAVSLVSPYTEARAFARELCSRFIEVYVSTSLEICEARDVKGLYQKARRGEIKQFTGIDDPYEPPKHPEITIDTSTQSIDASVAIIMNYIKIFI